MKNFILVIAIFIYNYSSGQWSPTNGPFGGRMNCIAASPAAMFAGSDGGGIFRSYDSGLNWAPVNNGIPLRYVNAIAIMGNHVVSACSPNGYSGAPGGIFVSTSLGNVWSLSTGNGFTNASTFLVDSNKIYAGTDNGLYVSIDSGYNWNAVNHALAGISVSSILKTDSIFYLTSFNGFYFSNNNGSTWTNSNNGLTALDLTCVVMKGNDLYLSGISTRICVSHDKGLNWIPLSTAYYATQSMLVYGNRIFAGNFYSDDDGGTWPTVNNDFGSVHCMITQGNDLYAAAWGDGAFHGCLTTSSDSGNTWRNINEGITASNIYRLTSMGSRIIAGSFDEGVYTSDDGGANWDLRNNSLTSSIILAFHTDSNALFAGTFGGGIYVSYDTANTWQKISASLTGEAILEFTVKDSDVCAFAYNGNYYSHDFGQTWNTTAGLPPNIHIRNVNQIGNRIFAMPPGSGIYYSDDGGENWTLSDSTIATKNFYSVCEVGPALLATGDGGIYKSTDNGIHWTLTYGIPFAKVFTDGTNVFAITNMGELWNSTDTGANWNSILSGMNNYIWDAEIAGNEIYCSFFCDVVWKVPMSLLTSSPNVKEEIQSDIQYPNPFSESIFLNLPQSNEKYFITIYNLLGEKILTKTAYSGKLNIETNSLSDGQYLIMVEQKSEYRFTKKIFHISDKHNR